MTTVNKTIISSQVCSPTRVRNTLATAASIHPALSLFRVERDGGEECMLGILAYHQLTDYL
jgi:hypothetical protein